MVNHGCLSGKLLVNKFAPQIDQKRWSKFSGENRRVFFVLLVEVDIVVVRANRHELAVRTEGDDADWFALAVRALMRYIAVF